MKLFVLIWTDGLIRVITTNCWILTALKNIPIKNVHIVKYYQLFLGKGIF